MGIFLYHLQLLSWRMLSTYGVSKKKNLNSHDLTMFDWIFITSHNFKYKNKILNKYKVSKFDVNKKYN
jgi:hypothetical protein